MRTEKAPGFLGSSISIDRFDAMRRMIMVQFPCSRPECICDVSQIASYNERQICASLVRNMEAKMKLTKLVAALVFSLSLAGASAAAAASVTGAAALALAGVVAQYAPLPAANKHAVAAFFKGDTNFPYKGKISVTADKIVCRTSNVDITARSCEVTFKTKKQTLNGREANELFATEAVAGIPADGA